MVCKTECLDFGHSLYYSFTWLNILVLKRRSRHHLKINQNFFFPLQDGKLAQEFYGEEAILKEEDLEEECIIEGCSRKFLSYFSMMRHVAFHHRPARTARLMKLFD